MSSESITVGLDVAPLAQTRAGTARYIQGLSVALEEQGDLQLRRYSFGGQGRVSTVARDVGWYLYWLAERAKRDGVDVLHCPSFRAPLRTSVPLVVTVHDLAVIRHPHTFNRWTRAYSARAVPRVVGAADAIIAVSEFTRREVIDLLDAPADRVRVIPNGVGPPFVPEGPARPGDFVLAVSTLEPRKNLARLLEGFQRAKLDGCELLVVGARGWGDVRIGGPSVRWLGEVADYDLVRLYRGALCVAYPSLYEGFGLPVLEAMACGAPVVTSEAPALRELADGAAVTVDALDPEAIAAGLEEAVARRDELRRAGIARAASYSWPEAAKATYAVYRSVVS